MADELTDSSNREQLIICLRWVDNYLAEKFIGLYSVDKIDAATLVHVIKDTLIHLNLKLDDCTGQCCDGAANMCGIRSAVATQLSAKEPRALFTHCYGHSLDLAACDSIKNSKIVKNALDVTHAKFVNCQNTHHAGTVYLTKLRKMFVQTQLGFISFTRILCSISF